MSLNFSKKDKLSGKQHWRDIKMLLKLLEQNFSTNLSSTGYLRMQFPVVEIHYLRSLRANGEDKKFADFTKSDFLPILESSILGLHGLLHIILLWENENRAKAHGSLMVSIRERPPQQLLLAAETFLSMPLLENSCYKEIELELHTLLQNTLDYFHEKLILEYATGPFTAPSISCEVQTQLDAVTSTSLDKTDFTRTYVPLLANCVRLLLKITLNQRKLAYFDTYEGEGDGDEQHAKIITMEPSLSRLYTALLAHLTMVQIATARDTTNIDTSVTSTWSLVARFVAHLQFFHVLFIRLAHIGQL